MKTAIAIITVALTSVSMAGERAALNRESKPADTPTSISLHLASRTAVRGFEPGNVGGGETMYVSPQAVFCGKDVASARAIATCEGADLLMTLTEEAAGHFARVFGEGGVDQLAILSGKRLEAAGRVSFDAATGVATVSGLPEAQARRLADLVGRVATASPGPAIAVVPKARVLEPGDSTTLDVYVSGVADLRTYQVTLTITGGSSGDVTIEDLSIDTGRSDFVFFDRYQIEAVDRTIGRIGALLFAGGADATDASYVGTYTVLASDEASGVFHIGLGSVGQSFLSNAANEAVEFGKGSAATLLVDALPHP
jgi:hypothetical protein